MSKLIAKNEYAHLEILSNKVNLKVQINLRDYKPGLCLRA